MPGGKENAVWIRNCDPARPAPDTRRALIRRLHAGFVFRHHDHPHKPDAWLQPARMDPHRHNGPAAPGSHRFCRLGRGCAIQAIRASLGHSRAGCISTCHRRVRRLAQPGGIAGDRTADTQGHPRVPEHLRLQPGRIWRKQQLRPNRHVEPPENGGKNVTYDLFSRYKWNRRRFQVGMMDIFMLANRIPQSFIIRSLFPAAFKSLNNRSNAL